MTISEGNKAISPDQNIATPDVSSDDVTDMGNVDTPSASKQEDFSLVEQEDFVV